MEQPTTYVSLPILYADPAIRDRKHNYCKAGQQCFNASRAKGGFPLAKHTNYETTIKCLVCSTPNEPMYLCGRVCHAQHIKKSDKHPDKKWAEWFLAKHKKVIDEREAECGRDREKNDFKPHELQESK
jgi:hypothetical protein